VPNFPSPIVQLDYSLTRADPVHIMAAPRIDLFLSRVAEGLQWFSGFVPCPAGARYGTDPGFPMNGRRRLHSGKTGCRFRTLMSEP